MVASIPPQIGVFLLQQQWRIQDFTNGRGQGRGATGAEVERRMREDRCAAGAEAVRWGKVWGGGLSGGSSG